MYTVVNNKVVRITYKYKRVIEKSKPFKSVPYISQIRHKQLSKEVN